MKIQLINLNQHKKNKFLEVDINSLFANQDVEDRNDNGDDGKEMDICIEVDSTYNLCTKVV